MTLLPKPPEWLGLQAGRRPWPVLILTMTHHIRQVCKFPLWYHVSAQNSQMCECVDFWVGDTEPAQGCISTICS